MPRGPADRPIRGSEEEAALQAARSRALEQGAAPVAAGPTPGREPPRFGTGVAATAPVRRVHAVPRTRAARSFALAKVRKKGRGESEASVPVPDPRGRGGRIDLRL